MLTRFSCAYWTGIHLLQKCELKPFGKFYWAFHLFIADLNEFLIYSDYKSSVKHQCYKYNFQSVTGPFIFLMVSFEKQEILILIKYYI